MNSLSKVVTQLCPEQELNPRPVDCKSNALLVENEKRDKVKKAKGKEVNGQGRRKGGKGIPRPHAG